MINFRGSLIRELVQRGNEVIALAPDYDLETMQAVKDVGAEPVGFRLSRLSTNPIEDLHTFLNLMKVLRTYRPDTVLSYTVKPIVYGTLAAWFSGARQRFALIEGVGQVFVSNDTSLRARTLRALVERLYRISLERAQLCFFVSGADLSDFVRRGLVAPAKAVQVGAIGLDMAHWPQSEPVIAPMTFTFVGRMQGQKGVREFVAAARAIKKRNREARFIILGGLEQGRDGVPEDEIRSWVVEGVVEWPGHVAVLPWLAKTSVFVLPSYREGAPRSTQEAMAVGRAVVTTDVPGCRDLVIDGVNGLLVPARDVAALATAMQRFLDEPELVTSMGNESRHLAERRFDASKFNALLIEKMRP